MLNSLTCGPLSQRRLKKKKTLRLKLSRHHNQLRKSQKRCLLKKKLKLKLRQLKNK